MKLASLFNLPPAVRRALLIAGDTLAVLIAVWAAFAIRRGEVWPDLLGDVERYVAWLKGAAERPSESARPTAG